MASAGRATAAAKALARAKVGGKLHGAGNCGTGRGGFKPGNTCGKGGRAKLAADIAAGRAGARTPERRAALRAKVRELKAHRRGKAGAVSDATAGEHRAALRAVGAGRASLVGPAPKPVPKPASTPKPKPVPKSKVVPIKPTPKPEPKPEPIPEPKPKARPEPAPITRADIEELHREIAGLERPSQRKRVVAAWLLERQVGPREYPARHGMSAPESFGRVTIDGLNFHFPAIVTGDEVFHPMVDTVLGLVARRDPLPAALARHTSDVFLSAQRNKNDAHWAKEYNIPDFRAGATGGEGAIVVYNGEPIGRGTLAHEMGHGFAAARYGSYQPGHASDFARAASSGEPPPTAYGRVHIQEDFAESVKLYDQDPAEFRATSPRRHDVIHRLMTEESYGG